MKKITKERYDNLIETEKEVKKLRRQCSKLEIKVKNDNEAFRERTKQMRKDLKNNKALVKSLSARLENALEEIAKLKDIQNDPTKKMEYYRCKYHYWKDKAKALQCTLKMVEDVDPSELWKIEDYTRVRNECKDYYERWRKSSHG